MVREAISSKQICLLICSKVMLLLKNKPSQEIENLSIANIITPNGDGTNEVFSFKHDIFKSFDILIVNRWGNVVHEGKNVTGTIFWDGKTQGGDPCSEGVYFYKLNGILKDNNPIEKTGFLELIR